MAKRILPLVFIFLCTSIAWVILGGANLGRTYSQDSKLKQKVGQLWGTIQRQEAPLVYYQIKSKRQTSRVVDGKTVVEERDDVANFYLIPDSNDISVNLKIDYRRKGLLWYSTYTVDFDGLYRVVNTTPAARDLWFEYRFPASQGVYDNFAVTVNGEKIRDLDTRDGKVFVRLPLDPGQGKTVQISYRSQGLDEWWYSFGQDVSQIRNFRLSAATDFDKVNFPDNGISPTTKERSGPGWRLEWSYRDLVSGIQIGIEMPKKLNPGPFVGKVSFFAPVSLFLFLFLMFIITAIKGIRIHPMNYFFVCAAFFAFHLLLAYLVDHLDLNLSFAIASAVSVLLVVSYMRLVAGARFALVEVGLSQLFYLVVFSYTFFLEGYTGLAVTIACILTLFVLMQATGRLDWDKLAAQGPVK
jgi:hypothetical protein